MERESDVLYKGTLIRSGGMGEKLRGGLEYFPFTSGGSELPDVVGKGLRNCYAGHKSFILSYRKGKNIKFTNFPYE